MMDIIFAKKTSLTPKGCKGELKERGDYVVFHVNGTEVQVIKNTDDSFQVRFDPLKVARPYIGVFTKSKDSGRLRFVRYADVSNEYAETRGSSSFIAVD